MINAVITGYPLEDDPTVSINQMEDGELYGDTIEMKEVEGNPIHLKHCYMKCGTFIIRYTLDEKISNVHVPLVSKIVGRIKGIWPNRYLRLPDETEMIIWQRPEKAKKNTTKKKTAKKTKTKLHLTKSSSNSPHTGNVPH